MNKLRIAGKIWRTHGITGIAEHVWWRLTGKPPRILPACIEAVKAGRGLEVGGPTPMFRRYGQLPVYRGAWTLRNCKFNISKTAYNCEYDSDIGYVLESRAEATKLDDFITGSYDFILSSHCLEPIGNRSMISSAVRAFQLFEITP